MIHICIAYALLGVRLSAHRYRVRRAYAGQGRHWQAVAA